MLHLPHVLGVPHQRGEDFVMVLATAQFPETPCASSSLVELELVFRKLTVAIRNPDKGALESLFLDDALLNWMKCAVNVSKPSMVTTFRPRTVCASTEHE